MATSNPSGTAVENSLTGGSILYTDTGTYNTVSSRILTVYDYQGNVLQVFNMGSSLTATYTFPLDAWFFFQCVVIDNTGTWTTSVYIVAQGYFWVAYLNQFTSNNCGCMGVNSNLDIGFICLQAALRDNLIGLGGAASAQRGIVLANFYVNQSVNVTYQ